MKGLITALVTPFEKGKIDWKSLERLLDWQQTQGVDGFVVSGTTGESPTLLESETEELFHFVRKRVSKEAPVILGTGTNSTQKTIEKTKRARELGASAAMVVTPYYNRPTPQGLREHFKKVAEATPDIPIMVYNVPSRTGTAITSEVLKDLKNYPNIRYLKEASGDMDLLEEFKKNFICLSGDDETCVTFCERGGEGVISVASQVIPRFIKEFLDSAKKGEKGVGEKYEKNWGELLKTLYSESNPIGVKMALYLMGIISSPELRLPMTTLSKKNTEKLKSVLEQKGLLK